MIYYSIMSNENDELLKLTSYVQISKYREKTLKSIGDEVKIPTNIAKDSGIRTNHISKVLSELKSKEIVECINEEARKGRLYRLTDTGKEVLDTIKDKEDYKRLNDFRCEEFDKLEVDWLDNGGIPIYKFANQVE